MAPPRMCFEFKPSFVVLVNRLPKLLRVGSMYNYWNSQRCAFGPDGIDTRVINLDTITLAIFIEHTETFVNLQAVSSLLNIFLQLLGHPCLPLGIINATKVDVCKNDEPFGIRALYIFQRFFKVISAASSSPTEINHNLHVKLIHVRHQVGQIL